MIGRVEIIERLLKAQMTPKETLRAMPLDDLRRLADQSRSATDDCRRPDVELTGKGTSIVLSAQTACTEE